MQGKLLVNLNSGINVLTTVLLCTFSILSSYTWGKYIMIACVGLIFCMQIIRDGSRYSIKRGVFPAVLLAFFGYTLMSVLWAQRASESMTMAKTLK